MNDHGMENNENLDFQHVGSKLFFPCKRFRNIMNTI